MCKIMLSINPEHVKKILNGEKKYEFRTKIAKQKVDSILIYCTSPVKRVLAEVVVDEVLEESPKKLWNITKYYSGIAYAYKLGKITQFETPKDISEFGCSTAPQSFVYIS